MPIVEAVVEMGEIPNPEFIIGAEDDWIVEWRQISDSDENKNLLNSEVGFKPPKYLQSGDQIRIEIGGIGVLKNSIVEI